MDTQAYIQSGIIEAYVLGLTTPDENTEVESICLQHPEVAKAIDDFSIQLEQAAMAAAVPPPANVKENILQALQNDFSNIQSNLQHKTNGHDNAQLKSAIVKKIFPWKMMAAASILLFVVSAAFNFHYYGKYTTAAQQNENLLAERNTMQANINVYKTSLSQFQSATSMMADPNMVMIKMKGQGTNEQSMATVFWDSESKDVFVMPNVLPAPAPGKQYQLWALVDGKPIDAGLMDANCIGVCKLKNITRADAFAITLENLGGSATPTLSQLFVLGNV